MVDSGRGRNMLDEVGRVDDRIMILIVETVGAVTGTGTVSPQKVLAC